MLELQLLLGYLLCDGTSYLRATYSALAAVLGCSGGSCAYGAADSTHFNVPDFRGRFLRGVDGSAGVDPDKASRSAMATGGNTGNNIGSVQADGFKSHNHTGAGGDFYINATGNTLPIGTGAFGVITASNTNNTGGNETRPVNAYVNYLIKY